MTFQTFNRIRLAIYSVVILFVAVLFVFILLPLFDIPLIGDLFFTVVFLLLTWVMLEAFYTRKIIQFIKELDNEYHTTLDNSRLSGLTKYLRNKVKFTSQVVLKSHYKYLTYIAYNITGEEGFPYYQEMKELEESYDDMYYVKAIVVRQNFMFEALQNGDLAEFTRLCEKQLTYIEKMIDENKVPDHELDYILNASTNYRKFMRLLEIPNVNNALAITAREKMTKADKLQMHYMIVRIFIEKDMIKEAKEVLDKALEQKGEHYILDKLRTYKKEL